MNHMQHLESVALSDCAVLESKEGTYQGSWKRAGGRSAWFMARRNMDRLLTMMPAKEVPEHLRTLDNIRSTLMALKQSVHYNFPPVTNTTFPVPGSIEATMAILDHVLDSYTADDIFARIAENPKGEDGTVLACMRDLRRYFVLVEAEMIAEGIVEPESKTYEGDRYPQDIYTMISDETGLDREEVKRRCHEACYKKQPEQPISFVPLEPITPITFTAPKATVRIRVAGGDSANYIFPNATNVVVTMGEEVEVVLEKGEFEPAFPTRPPLPANHPSVGAKNGDEYEDGNTGKKWIFRDGSWIPKSENGGYAKEQAARHRETQPTRELDLDAPIISEGKVYEGNRAVRPATPEDYEKAHEKPSALSTMRPIGPGTPEDGGHHASLVPWEIGDEYRVALVNRVGEQTVDAFYTKRALNVYRLEPIVSGVNRCPREISDCYDWWTHGLSVDSKVNLWVLKRANVPAELTDQFPLLQAEMNTVEYEQSPQEFRFMYVLIREKWTLASSFTAWSRES